jgi:ribosomal protein S18 acetylase RimI-like enzyme
MEFESTESREVQIRPFTMADKQQVIDLRVLARKTEPYVFPRSAEEEASTTDAAWKERFEKTLGGSATHMLEVAVVGNRVVGMAGAREVGSGIWDMHGVYVHPDFRGRKAGIQLIRSLVQKIKSKPGARSIEFRTPTTQKDALTMYKDAGFKIVGTEERPREGAPDQKVHVLRAGL